MAVFGLSGADDPAEDLSVFTGAFQVSFPILPNASSAYNKYRQPGATSPYPLDYVIDQEGRVAYFNTEYNPDAMRAVIDELLGITAPPPETPTAPPPTVTARPNPFNPRTEIAFQLPQTGRVSLDIHDSRGRLRRRLLVDELYGAGENTVVWDGTDDRGRNLPSGMYLVRVRSGAVTATGKLTLLR